MDLTVLNDLLLQSPIAAAIIAVVIYFTRRMAEKDKEFTATITKIHAEHEATSHELLTVIRENSQTIGRVLERTRD